LGCGGGRERCGGGAVSGVGGFARLCLALGLGWHRCRWMAPVLCEREG